MREIGVWCCLFFTFGLALEVRRNLKRVKLSDAAAWLFHLWCSGQGQGEEWGGGGGGVWGERGVKVEKCWIHNRLIEIHVPFPLF